LTSGQSPDRTEYLLVFLGEQQPGVEWRLVGRFNALVAPRHEPAPMSGASAIDHGNTQVAGSAGRIGKPVKPALQCDEGVLDQVLGQPSIACEQYSQP
jgi:hypothetical protein